MGAVLQRAARVVLLAGPAAASFFSGGYFDEPRAWAGLLTWILVVIAALTCRRLLPRATAGRLALLGLTLLGVWTLLSIVWAPIAGLAYHRGQLAMLYVGGLLAASALLRETGAVRAVEPALAGGILLVVGYGISERLLPGLLHFQGSISAQGRLEQPLTYWNAMGELAAIGVVLCARIAGDATRSRALRLAATAAAAPLGLGLYVSFSRGALFACAAGIVTLMVVAPWREQLRSGAVAVGAAILAAVASAPFGAVTSLAGGSGTRERQGAIVLGLLALVMLLTTGLQWRAIVAGAPGEWRLPRRTPLIALTLICAGLAVAIVAGAKEQSKQRLSTGASRFGTLQSNRYAYWRVAMRAFADEPIRGVGAGGWSVYWLRLRPVSEFAQDAHSLPLQTLAELGLVGLALLAVFLAGIGFAAGAAHRAAPALAAGPIAGIVTYIAHAPLDWDWQMPAVTMFALVLGGAVIALCERPRPDLHPAVDRTSAIPTAAR